MDCISGSCATFGWLHDVLLTHVHSVVIVLVQIAFYRVSHKRHSGVFEVTITFANLVKLQLLLD